MDLDHFTDKEYTLSLGYAARVVVVDEEPDHVFSVVRRALQEIGRMTEADEPVFLQGWMRYGLQKVSLKATFTPEPTGCSVELEAFGDDLWSRGARKGIEKLLRAAELEER